MTEGELVALLMTEMLPEALPVAEGLKVLAKAVLWPAASVIGTAIPLTLNPAPAIFTCERLTLLVPVFVNVMDCAALLAPTSTLPKLKLDALVESCSVD